MKRVDDVTAW